MSQLVRRLLASSRFFIIVAVVGSFIASATALVYGGVTTFLIVLRTVREADFSDTGAKLLAVELVTMIDLFLLGTVLYRSIKAYDYFAIEGIVFGVIVSITVATLVLDLIYPKIDPRINYAKG